MKKIYLITVAIMLSLFGCGSSEMISIDGVLTKVPYYGLANEATVKRDDVVYEPSANNIVVAIILCETVVVPIYVAGWEGMKPVYEKVNK